MANENGMKICGKSLGAGALVATLCAPAELGVTAGGERDYLVASGQRGSSCALVTVMLVAEPPPTYCP